MIWGSSDLIHALALWRSNGMVYGDLYTSKRISIGEEMAYYLGLDIFQDISSASCALQSSKALKSRVYGTFPISVGHAPGASSPLTYTTVLRLETCGRSRHVNMCHRQSRVNPTGASRGTVPAVGK